jgi:hypothetical protein
MHAAEHTARIVTSSFLKRIGLSPYDETNRAKAREPLSAFRTAIRCIQRRQHCSTKFTYRYINVEDI